MINETAGADPMSTYRNIGDYQVGLFDRFSKGLAAQGQKGQNLQFARMGYGGKGGSTYTNNALLDRISQNLAPTFASTLGSIGRDTQVVGNQRLQQGGQVVNLINARRGLQTQGAELGLNPALARAELADLEAGRLGTLGSAAKTNTAGFEKSKNFVGRLADGLSEAEDTILDTAMGVLSMYTGGGMMGGRGGGRPGASNSGTAARGQAPVFTPTYAPPTDFSAPRQQSYGPMAGGFNYGPSQQTAGASFYSPQVQDIMYGYRPGV